MKTVLAAAALAMMLPGLAMAQTASTGTTAGTTTSTGAQAGTTPKVGNSDSGNAAPKNTETGQTGSAEGTASGGEGGAGK